MHIYPISRHLAQQQNSKYYQTGVPCRHGHTDPKLTSNGACIGCRSARRKKHYEAHRDEILIKNRIHSTNRREQRPEQHKESAKRWRDSNKDVLSFHRTKRRKLTSIVHLTQSERLQLKEIYAGRPDGYHVDHIIPLAKGGKHHPDNLQYLPAIDNLRKGGRYTNSS